MRNEFEICIEMEDGLVSWRCRSLLINSSHAWQEHSYQHRALLLASKLRFGSSSLTAMSRSQCALLLWRFLHIKLAASRAYSLEKATSACRWIEKAFESSKCAYSWEELQSSLDIWLESSHKLRSGKSWLAAFLSSSGWLGMMEHFMDGLAEALPKRKAIAL